MELSYAAVCFDLFGTLVDADARPIPGAAFALDLFANARCAIVTSTSRRTALALLAQAGLRPPRVLICAGDVAHGKPASDPYLAGARALGVRPSAAIAVEDSPEGVRSASAAGMDVVAIVRGRNATFAPRATMYVERFDALLWALAEDGSIRVRIEPKTAS